MVKQNDILKFVMLISVIVGFIMFLMYGGASLNLTSDTTDDLIAAMPGIFIFTISIVTLTRVSGAYIMISMLGMGVGLAILIYSLFQTGLIIPDMLWGLTLQQNMALVIVLSGIIGGIVYASSRRG